MITQGHTIERLFGTLYLDGFLDDASRQRIVGEMQTAPGVAAGVYGRRPEELVETRTRSAERLTVSGDLAALVKSLMAGVQSSVGRHFGENLTSFEEPQFLRYGVGGFFVAHQDGNVSLIPDDSQHRRISIVVFVNSQSVEPLKGTYGGGSLVLHGKYPALADRYVVPASAGGLVAFRSETTHEVIPVTHGQRYTIVSWYRV